MNWFFLPLAAIHFLAALLVTWKAGHFAPWNRRRRIFAYIYVWLVPLIGPLTTFLMMKSDGGGESDPNLKYSIEYIGVTQDGHDHR